MTKPKAESKATTKTTTKAAAKTAPQPAPKVAKSTAKVGVKVAAAPKTPAQKKPVAAKAASGTTATKKAAAPRKKATSGNTVPLEQRAHYVEIAAFYIAERRGFAPGNPMEDWLAAEAEIDRLLAEGRLG